MVEDHNNNVRHSLCCRVCRILHNAWRQTIPAVQHLLSLCKPEMWRAQNNIRVVSVRIWIWFYAIFTDIMFITLDTSQQNTDFCRTDSSQNSKPKHEMNYCTHCVTLFLVPLLIVAGYADIGKADLLLHLQTVSIQRCKIVQWWVFLSKRCQGYNLLFPILGHCCRGERRTDLCNIGSETAVVLLSAHFCLQWSCCLHLIMMYIRCLLLVLMLFFSTVMEDNQ